MPNTFIKIQTVTVGAGGAANIDFTSIPQTYTDLQMVFSLRSNRAAGDVDIVDLKFNNTSANRSSRELFGSGASVGSGNDASTMYVNYCSVSTNTASVFSNGQLYVPNYTSSNFKSASSDHVSENNATNAYQTMYANLWSNTAAINRITIAPVLGTLFVEYSSATLYGIKSS